MMDVPNNDDWLSNPAPPPRRVGEPLPAPANDSVAPGKPGKSAKGKPAPLRPLAALGAALDDPPIAAEAKPRGKVQPGQPAGPDAPPPVPDDAPPADKPAADTAPPKPPRKGRPFGEIWKDCPVKALGVLGKAQYLLDVHGQLREEIKLDIGTIASLFGNQQTRLWHRYPSYAKGADTPSPMRFDQGKAQSDIIAACADRGVFNPVGRVRGPGAWVDDDGALIYHAGDEVLVAGAWQPPGLHGGRIYPAASSVPRPAVDPGRDPAREALDLLATWRWRRPDLDPVLALGLTCAQMLGGALDWRPVGWWTGDASTGKSNLQKALLLLHGGEAGLLQAADATEAGIRSVVGQSSLPVAVDELEPDTDNARKVKGVIELARRAASGGVVFRGASDQKGHQSMARSAFVFSSILVPPMPAQDRSRLILLELDRFPPDAPKLVLDPRKLRRIGAQIKRRLIEGWPGWAARLEAWRAGLAVHGLTGRGADNYATVLAMADMALFDAASPADVIDGWAVKLAGALSQDSVEVGSNADDMLTHLLGQEFDVYRSGEKYIIAQWLMTAAGLPGAPTGILNSAASTPAERQDEANRKLAKAGLRIEGKANAGYLVIASSPLPELEKLFRDSTWQGAVWAQAARRLPGAEPRPTMSFAGQKSRATAVPLRAIPYLFGMPPDAVAPAPHPANKPLPPDLAEFV